VIFLSNYRYVEASFELRNRGALYYKCSAMCISAGFRYDCQAWCSPFITLLVRAPSNLALTVPVWSHSSSSVRATIFVQYMYVL
jgi:hypothetical protein